MNDVHINILNLYQVEPKYWDILVENCLHIKKDFPDLRGQIFTFNLPLVTKNSLNKQFKTFKDSEKSDKLMDIQVEGNVMVKMFQEDKDVKAVLYDTFYNK